MVTGVPVLAWCDESREGSELALRWAELLGGALGAPVDSVVGGDGPSVAIDRVRKADPRMLVICLSLEAREGGGTRLELPAEPAALLTRVACPVLWTRCDLGAPPHRVRTLLAGIDFGIESIGAAQFARALAAPVGGERLVLAHVCDDADASAHTGKRSEWLREREERAERELERLREQLEGVGSRLETARMHGDPAGVLTALAQLVRADWLVLGGQLRGERARAALGPLLLRVLRDACCPVLRMAC
jgi:nucleotide-binding universal stress UspA family protein